MTFRIKGIAKKILVIVTIASIFSLFIIPTVSYALTSSVEEDLVTTTEVKQVAISTVKDYSSEFPDWTNAGVSTPMTYYNVNKQPVAYEFTVLNDKGKAGFIIISGLKQWMPVLELGTGDVPSSYLSNAYTVAEEKGFISAGIASEPIIYYFGSLSYYVQIGEQMAANGSLIYLPTGEIAQMPKTQPILQMDANAARAEWSRILGGDERKGVLTTTVNLTDVPYWYQSTNWNIFCDEGDAATSYPACVGPADDYWANWDGCAPISGAMVFGYWDSHGYSNFPANDDDELIDQCHHFMQTDYAGGTIDTNIPGGVIATSQVYGYNFGCNTISNPSWNNYLSYINIGMPFIFSIYPWSGGYHAVCATGYQIDPNKVIIHSTYSGSDMYIAWGSWTWMRMDIPQPG